MTRTANIDPPPPGPIRWRWVTKAFASLLRAAGIISPDESVNIDATTGGFTLSQKQQSTNRIRITSLPNFNTFEVPELNFDINNIDSYTIPKQTIFVPDGYFLCAKIEYELNSAAMDKTPIFSSLILLEDIADLTVTLEAITILSIDQGKAASPGGKKRGIIYIPLAVKNGSLIPLVNGQSYRENDQSELVYSANFEVTIYHGAFKFRDF